jgi:hypothetical protein
MTGVQRTTRHGRKAIETLLRAWLGLPKSHALINVAKTTSGPVFSWAVRSAR